MEPNIYIDQCTSFVQRGQYAKDVLDYCIDCTANAIRVNLTIKNKESSDVYLLGSIYKLAPFIN